MPVVRGLVHVLGEMPAKFRLSAVKTPRSRAVKVAFLAEVVVGNGVVVASVVKQLTNRLAVVGAERGC